MEDALQRTFYCDHDHLGIQEAAADLRAGEEDPVAITRRSFYFVRDRIRFGIDLYQRKASETLKRGYGACWNKSLLLVALLRCNQIPARFGSVPLRRDFIKPAIGAWHWLVNNPYNHCLVHVYLDGRWTVLDPVLDKGTYETSFLPLGVAWGIDWNGKDDVRLYTESVIGPTTMRLDIDAAINTKAGNTEMPQYFAIAGNWFINRTAWKRSGNNSCMSAADHAAGSH